MEAPIKILMTATDEGPRDNSILHTPSGEANVQVQTWDIWRQIGVRVLRSWVQNIMGYLLGAGVGAVLGPTVASAAVAIAATAGVDVPIPARSFITLLVAAFSASLGPTFLCFLQNFLELSAGWDKTVPKFRA